MKKRTLYGIPVEEIRRLRRDVHEAAEAYRERMESLPSYEERDETEEIPCGCGCGTIIKKWRPGRRKPVRFARGHHRPEHKRNAPDQRRCPSCGRWLGQRSKECPLCH